jgi:rod shape-determining protein MreB and related proteins
LAGNVTDIGIDLGTASILVYIRGKGVVLKEPTVVAYDKDSRKIQALGEEARLMLGRTPGNIMAVRPMKAGVISDYIIAEQLLKYFVDKAIGRNTLRKPRMSICVPVSATEVERKAVEDAAFQAGARSVTLVEEPVAAALGAGIDISKPNGNMIVDVGGGSTDIAIVSMNECVISASAAVGGNDFDNAIVRYVRKKYNLLIGERTAEDIKIRIGSCYEGDPDSLMEVRGRSLISGLPKTIVLSAEETEEVLSDLAYQIVEAIRAVLEQTPPELAADILDRGIVLTGGASQLRGLEQMIADSTELQTRTAEDPMNCVAIGTGKFSEFISAGRRAQDILNRD